MSKKKNKRKRQQHRPPGVDPNEKRRQRLEEKRRQREAAAKAQRRAAFRERLVRGMVFAGIVVAAIWFFFLRTQTPSEIDGFEVQTFREQSGHTNDPVDYPMTPPVTGNHAEGAAPCGVHGVQIPDELFVHSLEHGAVGVLYDPNVVEVETIREIEALAGEYDDRTISAPYADTQTPITLTSWGELMRLPGYEEDTIREYIDAFKNKGPEDFACENESDTPFDPQSLEPPAPEEGDGGEDQENEDGQDDETKKDREGRKKKQGNSDDDS